jgi:hypothetical protein
MRDERGHEMFKTAADEKMIQDHCHASGKGRLVFQEHSRARESVKSKSNPVQAEVKATQTQNDSHRVGRMLVLSRRVCASAIQDKIWLRFPSRDDQKIMHKAR